jgi:hypothetical protein
MCAVVGQDLPINDIGYGTLSHKVPAGDPPIELPSGPVRQVTVGYYYEEYPNEFPN